MKKINTGLFAALIFLGIILIQSCVKKEFDTPPDNSGFDPGLTVTHTIKEIQELPSPTSITEDWIIAGIVNMDDKEGNYYKKITIQDETGGIEILLDQNNLYNDYPVGRKVYVKLKGLSKSAYNNLPQLGYTPDAGGSLVNVPFTLISDHIIKANYPNTLTPVEVSLAELGSASVSAGLVNKLVTIKDVEFSPELIGLSIADPATVRSATNRNLQQCGSTTKVVVRTSGYAKFQNAPIPGGKGTITALFTVFGSTPQLVIRSMDDLQLNEERCDGSAPTGPETITISELKALYTGTSLPLTSKKIQGVIISDRTNGNILGPNLILQQGNSGIAVRFSGSHSFNVGDSLEILVSGANLEEFNSLLQVNGVPLGNAVKVGTGNITPKIVTLSELNADFENHESTLVKVSNVTFSGSGTYAGNKTINDGTGTITLYSRNDASFATNALPTSAVTITALVGQFGSTRQLQMRNIADVE